MTTVIIKWKDRQEVLALSRRHTDSKTKIQQREGMVKVPIMVVDYSNSKAFIIPDKSILFSPTAE
jgi:hypothetical protein